MAELSNLNPSRMPLVKVFLNLKCNEIQRNCNFEKFCVTYQLYFSSNGSQQGLKYLKMLTTNREGRWRGRRPRARHGGAKRRSAEGVGSGEGQRSPSPVWGSGGIAPRKFWNLTVQICSFFHDFKTEIALPSVHSFTAYICSRLFIIDHPVVFSKVNTVKQNSEIW